MNLIDNVLSYGPHWLWKTLEYHGENGYDIPFETSDKWSGWEDFFTPLKQGRIVKPEQSYLLDNEFEVGILPLLKTPILGILTSDKDLLYKIWLLRWGVDQDNRLFGSAFYADPETLIVAEDAEKVAYSDKMPRTRFGPQQLMYDSLHFAEGS